MEPISDADRWRGYLDERGAADRVEALERFVGFKLRPAITYATDNVVSLSWNDEREFFEVELSRGGFEWFYRDRVTKAVDGSETRGPLPTRALELLCRIGKESPSGDGGGTLQRQADLRENSRPDQPSDEPDEQQRGQNHDPALTGRNEPDKPQ